MNQFCICFKLRFYTYLCERKACKTTISMISHFHFDLHLDHMFTEWTDFGIWLKLTNAQDLIFSSYCI